MGDFFLFSRWPSVRPDVIVPEAVYQRAAETKNPPDPKSLGDGRKPWERGLRRNYLGESLWIDSVTGRTHS
jgi:hypothetical protein